jgi:hypothetical protein
VLQRSGQVAAVAALKSSTPAQKGKRDVLTRRLFEDMNARIFEGKLPCDLEIRWNARLNTTAGITVFQVLLCITVLLYCVPDYYCITDCHCITVFL